MHKTIESCGWKENMKGNEVVRKTNQEYKLAFFKNCINIAIL